jgi:hypothetical protein
LRRLLALDRPEPDGAVKPFQRQVGQLFGELQLDFDARIALLKAGKRRPQPQAPKSESGDQADQSGRLRLALLQL